MPMQCVRSVYRSISEEHLFILFFQFTGAFSPAGQPIHAILLCRYQRHGPLRGTGAPVVGVLLYRKHVITEQPYILQLISLLEQVGQTHMLRVT